MNGHNVLVVEQVRGDADADAEALALAGNHPFRCFPDRPGVDHGTNPFACVGVTEGVCPLDSGIDVAVVRSINAQLPSIFSAGALCALRRGIPVARIDEFTDVVGACDAAVESDLDALRLQVQWRVTPIMSEIGVRHDALSIRFECYGPNLRVTLVGPPVDDMVKQRLAMRVIDGIRSTRRSFDKQSVCYEES